MGNRTISERFGIPHAVTPNLGVGEAIAFALGAMARIFLGSFLFAVWGVFSIRSFDAIQSHFWRAVVLVPLAFVFAISFGALMIAISAVLKRVSPKRG